MGKDAFACDNCGSEDSIAYVHYGSYVLKCAKCRADNVATSFIAVYDLLSETYKAIEIDEDINQIRTIAEGKLSKIKDSVRNEANRGKLIWLKVVGD